jgi:hypothetical protein
MTPTLAGSLASASDSVIDVTMLIHSTCMGWSGIVRSNSTATRMTSDWAPLVGSRKRIDLRMLS